MSEPYEVQEPYETNEPYQVEEPYTYTDTGTATLFDDKYSVKAGYYLALPTYIRLHDSDFVSGTVEETTGHDITLYVLDQKNYNAYKAGQSYTPYVYLSRVNSSYFSFTPDHTDYYYFVLYNGYSWITPKLVALKATNSWSESRQGYRTVTEYRTVTKYRTVTEYRDVEKQRIVTKYRQETRYKEVSLLDYWLNYASY